MSPSFQVVAAQEVRRLPEKEGMPPRAVDHLTLSAGGVERLVTMFRKVGDPLPASGSTIEGELGDPDNFDKDRRKFSRPRSGGGGGGGGRQTHPEDARRMGRCHSQAMAMEYITAKIAAGKIEDFDFSDVSKLTDAFERDIAGSRPTPPSETPVDTEGLPKLSEPI